MTSVHPFRPYHQIHWFTKVGFQTLTMFTWRERTANYTYLVCFIPNNSHYGKNPCTVVGELIRAYTDPFASPSHLRLSTPTFESPIQTVGSLQQPHWVAVTYRKDYLDIHPPSFHSIVRCIGTQSICATSFCISTRDRVIHFMCTFKAWVLDELSPCSLMNCCHAHGKKRRIRSTSLMTGCFYVSGILCV